MATETHNQEAMRSPTMANLDIIACDLLTSRSKTDDAFLPPSPLPRPTPPIAVAAGFKGTTGNVIMLLQGP
ncbi:hypothetical protein CDAR_91801 [Caerostris darwini]|uniref:Uncharacterized protein n=1 Tax=Caerostris darwini TaxID=1538125 RepID=A0AAV4QMA7_9ARAC|nr:hypothetical protein CDAR_91801 [Caerostris darwini]